MNQSILLIWFSANKTRYFHIQEPSRELMSLLEDSHEKYCNDKVFGVAEKALQKLVNEGIYPEITARLVRRRRFDIVFISGA